MKRILFVFAALALAVFSAPALTSAQRADSKPQRVIVAFNHAVNEDARAALRDKGAQTIQELELINAAVVVLPDKVAVDKVRGLSNVQYVEPDIQVHALHHRSGHNPGPGSGDGGTSPPQPAQTLEWGVDRIDADLAWPASTGAGVNVAVIDTGIDLDHPDLNVIKGVDCTKGPNCAKGGSGDDDNGHGTHVAGIAAARDNTIGVVGVAPSANLQAVKVLNQNGSGFLSDVIEGIEWSVNNGSDVINMSLGTSSNLQSLHDAVDAANTAGLVVVAAAGNEGDGNPGTNEVSYPAKYSSVIAVSATAQNDSTPVWSSEGAEVEVAAPGVAIRSTVAGGGYDTFSGTSMASPHTAGVVALLLSSGVSPADIRTTLRSTADDLGSAGFDNHYGWGLVDAEESVTGVQTP
jgi:subtilisin family serine protease